MSTGTLQAPSLRTVKEAALEVQRGDDCGLGLDGFNDFSKGVGGERLWSAVRSNRRSGSLCRRH